MRVLVLLQVRLLASGYEPDERLLLDTRNRSGRTPRSRTGINTGMGRVPYYLEPACGEVVQCLGADPSPAPLERALALGAHCT